MISWLPGVGILIDVHAVHALAEEYTQGDVQDIEIGELEEQGGKLSLPVLVRAQCRALGNVTVFLTGGGP